MRVLLLDNYDSFTWNLAHQLQVLGVRLRVLLHDEIEVDEVLGGRFGAVVISPGPGRPEEAGISVPLVRAAARRGLPLFGVCLGHQALAVAFGGRVVRAPVPMHGKTSPIEHDGRGLFRGLPAGFAAMRYHSLAVREAGLPAVLRVTARSNDGVVQGLAHRRLPLFGVQFHPESVLTPWGSRLVGNFLALAARACPGRRMVVTRQGRERGAGVSA